MDYSYVQSILNSIQIVETPDPCHPAQPFLSVVNINGSEYGYVKLIDFMPRGCPPGKTRDCVFADAARVSTNSTSTNQRHDERLARFLKRHHHDSCFEMAEVKFEVSAPLFVARQWFRHRTGNFNEQSARYSEVPDTFFVPLPEDVCVQSSMNHQGRGTAVEDNVANEFVEQLKQSASTAYTIYQGALHNNIARETARMILPVCAYTKYIWKCDIRNVFGFLQLRMDSHAQKEIVEYANAIFCIIYKLFPVATQSFVDYSLCSITLSRMEAESIRNRRVTGIEMESREIMEFKKKLDALCIDVVDLSKKKENE